MHERASIALPAPIRSNANATRKKEDRCGSALAKERWPWVKDPLRLFDTDAPGWKLAALIIYMLPRIVTSVALLVSVMGGGRALVGL
jgi:hypothetical protein